MEAVFSFDIKLIHSNNTFDVTAVDVKDLHNFTTSFSTVEVNDNLELNHAFIMDNHYDGGLDFDFESMRWVFENDYFCIPISGIITNVEPVPEPSTFALTALALVGLFFWRKKSQA